jgi:hypothetical protein
MPELAAQAQTDDFKSAHRPGTLTTLWQYLVTETTSDLPQESLGTAVRSEGGRIWIACPHGSACWPDQPFRDDDRREEQERLFEAHLNDAAVGSTIDIDPRLVPRIVMTELQGLCAP